MILALIFRSEKEVHVHVHVYVHVHIQTSHFYNSNYHNLRTRPIPSRRAPYTNFARSTCTLLNATLVCIRLSTTLSGDYMYRFF